MLNLDNHVFNLILHEEELKLIIQEGAQKVVNQSYSFTLPVLGTISAKISSIRSTKVVIANGQIFYDLEAGLEITPNSRLLPNVFGLVSLQTSVKLSLNGSPSIDFRILDFQWLEGPKSSKGKLLKWIKRLSSQLLNNLDVVESIIERKMTEKLTPVELQKLIENFISTSRITSVPMHLRRLSVRLSPISFQHAFVLVQIGYSLQMSDESGNLEVQVDFGKIDEQQVANMSISEQSINKILQANIRQINRLLSSSPVKVQDISLQIKPQVLHTSIVPSRFSEKPIELLLKLLYQPDLKMIELLDCQISPNESAGAIIRGIFKLMGGRLEDAIEKYFPLDPAEILQVLIERTTDKGTVELHLDDLKFLDIQILDGQLSLVVDYTLQIEVKTRYLINKKDPVN